MEDRFDSFEEHLDSFGLESPFAEAERPFRSDGNCSCANQGGRSEAEEYSEEDENFQDYEQFQDLAWIESEAPSGEAEYSYREENEAEWESDEAESGWSNEAPKAPSHSFSGCDATKKQLLTTAAERARKSVGLAVSLVGSAYGRPDRMSAILRNQLTTHFKTTQRKHLRTILSNLMGIRKVLSDGVPFVCESKTPIINGKPACGWAYNSQWFGGFGGINIAFEAGGTCNFATDTIPGVLDAPNNQDRILIHEVAHRYEGLDDHAYGWEATYATLPTKQALDNADSYAMFCVELHRDWSAAAGGGGRATGGRLPGTPKREAFVEDFEYIDEFEELGDFEDESEEETTYEQDPSVAGWAEKIVARETPLFELESPSKWTSCFTATDVDRVKKLYADNVAAAQRKDVDRASCIVMLNSALGTMLGLGMKRHRARSKSNRMVMMANLTTDTIEKAMTQLRRKSYATPPAVLNFFDRRNRTAGTLKPERLKQSVSKYATDNATQNCWTAFSLSVMDGYHSVLVLVDRTSASAKIYWLDQFTNGLGDDVSATLDERLTQTTQSFWQGVMDRKKVGYNTTIRLWKLRKRNG